MATATDTLRRLFELAGVGTDADGQRSTPTIVDYATDAPRLWSDLGARLDGDNLIVLWDASDRLLEQAEWPDTAEFLNPIAWAIFAMAANPDLNLSIVDMSPSTHSKLLLHQAAKVVDPERAPFRLCTGDARPLDLVGSFAGNNRMSALVLMHHQLRDYMVRGGSATSRHALANSLGPLVLLGKSESGERSPNAAVLRLLLKLGIISAPMDSARRAIDPEKAPNDELMRATSPFRVLLVDDQASCGWDRWVARLTARYPGGVVESISGIAAGDTLVGMIANALGAGNGALDRRFELDLPCGEPVRPPNGDYLAAPQAPADPWGAVYLDQDSIDVPRETVLALDLRLHALQSVNVEARFVREQVLPQCEKFREGNGRTFAWPGFTERELDEARAWCADPIRDNERYITVATLLPRLVALVDMAVPVILFSSSHERQIINILRPYANIITGFVKPKFGGYDAADIVADSEERFLHALNDALRLVRAKRRVASIQRDAELLAKKYQTLPTNPGNEGGFRYVELFLDESEYKDRTTDRPLDQHRVGGCFAVFEGKTEDEAKTKADAFDDLLVAAGGIRYFDNRGIGSSPLPGEKLLSKGADLSARINSCFQQTSNCAPIYFGLVRITVDTSMSFDGADLVRELRVADHRFFAGLHTALEAFLGESAFLIGRGKGSSRKTTVSVFPSERVVDIPDENAQIQPMLTLGFRKVGTHRSLFYSLGREHVYPIVGDVLNSRKPSCTVWRALAVKLPYHDHRYEHSRHAEHARCVECGRSGRYPAGNIPSRCPRDRCADDSWRLDYRALHYVADEVLTEFPEVNRKRRYGAVFGEFDVPGEFDDVLDDDLLASLHAGRMWDARRFGEALAFHRPQLPIALKPRVGQLLSRRIAAALTAVSGNDLVAAGHLLDQRLTMSVRSRGLHAIQKRWATRVCRNERERQMAIDTYIGHRGYEARVIEGAPRPGGLPAASCVIFADLNVLKCVPEGFTTPEQRKWFMLDGQPRGALWPLPAPE
jgi:hypothetical protein